MLVCGWKIGVHMISITVKKEEYSLLEDSNFNYLPKEIIYSMVPLSNEKYLCTINSGSLLKIDIKHKIMSKYAPKYYGKYI